MKNRIIKPLLSDYLTNKRIQAARPYIKGNVLDLGCGYTKIPSLLSPGQKYVGVDKNPIIFNRVQKEYPEHKFLNLDIERDIIDLEDKYDTILLIAVIEHLINPQKLIKHLQKFLFPDGVVIITTPTPMGGIVHNIGAEIFLFHKAAKNSHKGFYRKESLDLLQKSWFRLKFKVVDSGDQIEA